MYVKSLLAAQRRSAGPPGLHWRARWFHRWGWPPLGGVNQPSAHTHTRYTINRSLRLSTADPPMPGHEPDISRSDSSTVGSSHGGFMTHLRRFPPLAGNVSRY